MKKIFRKNQIIIAALAVMIAAAGYLNYSGRLFGEEDTAAQTSGDLASQELLDISEEDVSASSGDIESQDADAEATGTEEGADDGSVDGTPGEAVLTSGDASAVVAEAKVTREQVRAKNKEDLLSIIDNQNLSDEQKQDAVNQMVQMTDLAEKEAAAETLLASKGFDEAVVSLTADSADVVVNASELSDANRAQIEDIITRKTGIAAQNIVITPINTAE
nr:SpoIIIAH-like family protein [Lachnoclostridium phocaeense]